MRERSAARSSPPPWKPFDGRAKLVTVVAVLCLIASVSFACPPWLAPRLGRELAALINTVGILFAALGLGRALARACGAGDGPSTPFLLPGLGLLAFAVYTAAAFGLFHPGLVYALLALGLVSAVRRDRARPATPPALALPWEALPAALLALLIVGTPVVFWDCRSYHLAIPEYILAHGGIDYPASYIMGYFPLAMESLYAVAFCLPAGEATAQALNIALMLLAGEAALRLASAHRRLGATLLVSSPAVLTLAVLPKNSALLVFASVSAFAALLSPDESPARRRAFLAGSALGLALATHYAAFWLVPFLLVPALRRLPRSGLAIALAIAILLASPVYVRNAWLMHNPVYPAFASLFHTPLAASLPSEFALPRSAGAIVKALFAPWFLVEPFGIGSTLGPLALLALLLALPHIRRAPNAIALLVAGGGLLLMAALLYRELRFGLAGFFLLAPLAAIGAARGPRLFRALAGLQSLAAVLFLTYYMTPLSALVHGDEAYRARFDPAWPLAQYARTHLDDSARIATAGILLSYGWQGRLEPSSEFFPPALGPVLERSVDGMDARRRLRALGFTHLAVDFVCLDRLQRDYGHLAMDDRRRRVFLELLGGSRRLAGTPDAVLVRL